MLSILTVNGLDEAIRVLNGTRYGLSSSIYTRDVNAAMRAVRDIEAGITYVNGPTIGAEVHLPFGGVKDTGNGHREASHTVLDIFSEWKSVYVDYSRPPAAGADRHRNADRVAQGWGRHPWRHSRRSPRVRIRCSPK